MTLLSPDESARRVLRAALYAALTSQRDESIPLAVITRDLRAVGARVDREAATVAQVIEPEQEVQTCSQ